MNNAHKLLIIALSLSFTPAVARMKVTRVDKELLRAAKQGNITLVKKALTDGANINCYDRRNHTALMHAVLADEPELVKYLLAYGANPHLQDTYHHTALQVAKKRSFDECAHILEKAMR